MKFIVLSLLIFGLLTSIIILAVAGYMYKKLQKKSNTRKVNSIIRESTSTPTSQETMIYSKEDLDTMQKKDLQDHRESTGGFRKQKPIQTSDNFNMSQPSSIGFVPRPALLDAPEEISQTQVLPKNIVGKSSKRQQRTSKDNLSPLDDIAPPEEISGLGFNASNLSPNRHRNISAEDDSDESDIDPEDSTNIIPK